MGQSSSTEQDVSPELREVQSLAASTGALPSIQKSFSLLSDPQTKSIPIQSLQKCFDFTLQSSESDQGFPFKEAQQLLTHLGSAIVDLFFVAGKDGVNWIEFLRGYTKCCARTAASTSFNNLFRVFSATCSKSGIPVDLQFESLGEDECKINGSLYPHNTLVFLWICWMISWDSRVLKSNPGKSRGKCSLPDISHLVLSVVEACVEDGHNLDFWDSNVLDLDIKLPAAKVCLWALKNTPNLADCLVQFVHARLCYLTTREEKPDTSSSSANESSSSPNLLTPGRAWAISLALRGPIHEEISKVCFPSDSDETNENVLYRSSVHGKGLNRFWSNIEGYNGPLLTLIESCEDKHDNNSRRWVIGVLTDQGFQNKEVFYGTSGSLFALSPVFRALLSSGREKNYVYSHLHPSGRVYDAHPKQVGLGFGGKIGNERVFVDEDFSRVTVRHHAVDKTYQQGALFPNQGFLPVEASVCKIEVWGLGGSNALKAQASYKKREELFTEQRRTVDLKTFSNWEDSPEKMMMDMISNPNAVRREDR